jgi:hypothetical protein
LLPTKDEQLTQSRFQLKIEIGLKRRKLAGVILSPVGLIVQSRVLLLRHISEMGQPPGRLGDRGPACGRNLAFSRVSLLHLTTFSGICGSKFSKIFKKALERGDTIPVRPAKSNSPLLELARVARENHLTSLPRKFENEVLRNPIKVPEGELLRN